MSDTPRTDKAVYLTKGPNFNAVCPSFARELECENAALREQMKELERKLAAETEYAAETHARHEGLVEQIAKLNSENAALREDKERLDWIERNGPWDRWIDPDGPDITLRKPIRDCIDAARKEAQP